MLTRTFCHLPGVGPKTESKIWAAGANCWEMLLGNSKGEFSRYLKPAWLSHLQESSEQHASRNLAYFSEKLPGCSQWRMYEDFQDSCAYLDIETTGLSWYDEITTIALFDGRTIRHYVNGHNLEEFARDITEYRLLVTYNGKSFDVPFIERSLKIKMPQAHIDLRYTLGSLGIVGGLKECERRLGLGRSGLEDVDGFLAVMLWRDYRGHGNIKSLETLLAYNIQDTLSLQTLMIHAHNEKVKETPFAAHHFLPPRDTPLPPFRPDRDTVERVKYQGGASPFAGVSMR